jgi:methyltransferase (TIGR00027 family)
MEEPLRLAKDPVARAILPPWLGVLAGAIERAPAIGPAVHHTLSLVTTGLAPNLELRTRAIDEAIAAAVADGARQLVLLGAGLDGRAYRLDGLEEVDVFEIDHPAMARWRAERFEAAARAGKELASRARSVRSVAVDFERERLDDALASAGLHRDAPAVIVWEGVTMYLTREALRVALRALADVAAPGSRVLATYAPPDAPVTRHLLPIGRDLARLVGEPLHGLIGVAEMASELARVGFVVERDESAADWVPRYWPASRAIPPIWERLVIARLAR